MDIKRKRLKGFTLIELLIVVAIIAILAAIAVPNFLEAQVRAKVSRTKADMRTVITAMEAYRVDWNTYPPDDPPGRTRDTNELQCYLMLTTPVAYITFIPIDVFFAGEGRTSAAGHTARAWPLWEYSEENTTSNSNPAIVQQVIATGAGFTLNSVGPDKWRDFQWDVPGWQALGRLDGSHIGDPGPPPRAIGYDPTNGTVSYGDITGTRKGFVGGGGR